MTEKGEPAQDSGLLMIPRCMQSQGMNIPSLFPGPGEMSFPVLNSSQSFGQVIIEAHIHNNF